MMIDLISLGAGVQSSTMALMAEHGEIEPKPMAAIFSDTRYEPHGVYDWLDWLETMLSFPVYRVSSLHDLVKQELTVRKSGRSGRLYRKSAIPLFLDAPDKKSNGMIRRECTRDFKIIPIRRKVRQLANIQRGENTVRVRQWIGISLDEMQRMKPSRDKWCEHRWPLVEKRMTRHLCLEWMRDRGYPEPPRSACVFCPYHSDSEWRRLRDEQAPEFERAVEFERQVQSVASRDETARGKPFLHNSCRPLDQVEFDDNQMAFAFMDECEGMCGV